MSVNSIKQKDITIEIHSLEKFNDSYKQKWEGILTLCDTGGGGMMDPKMFLTTVLKRVGGGS